MRLLLGESPPVIPDSPAANHPPGAVTQWAGQAGTIPSGWLLCDGSTKLRYSYGALFAAIGTLYGSADSLHFNVPDLRTKFAEGVATTPATSGGSDTHTHPLSDAGQAAIELVTSTPFIRERRIASSSWAPTLGITFAAAASNTTSQSTATALLGVTDAGDGRPPYLNLLFLIKI